MLRVVTILRPVSQFYCCTSILQPVHVQCLKLQPVSNLQCYCIHFLTFYPAVWCVKVMVKSYQLMKKQYWWTLGLEYTCRSVCVCSFRGPKSCKIPGSCTSKTSALMCVGRSFEGNPRSGEILQTSSRVDGLAVSTLVILETVAKEGKQVAYSTRLQRWSP